MSCYLRFSDSRWWLCRWQISRSLNWLLLSQLFPWRLSQKVRFYCWHAVGNSKGPAMEPDCEGIWRHKIATFITLWPFWCAEMSSGKTICFFPPFFSLFFLTKPQNEVLIFCFVSRGWEELDKSRKSLSMCLLTPRHWHYEVVLDDQWQALGIHVRYIHSWMRESRERDKWRSISKLAL